MLWLFLAIAVVGAAVVRYGADSRDGKDWQPMRGARWPARPARRPHTVSADIRALRAHLK